MKEATICRPQPAIGRAALFLPAAADCRRKARSENGSTLLLSMIALGLIAGVVLAYYAGAEWSAPSASPTESARSLLAPKVSLANLSSTGKSAYFNLEPGYLLRYQDGQTTRTVTVRRKTKVVDGVETRVVQQRDESRGQLIKMVWKCYAIDKTTHALYCFGVRTQTYKNGQLVDHRGWLAGVGGATFTLVLPTRPVVGDKFVHRHDSTKANRLYEVTEVAEKVVTPAGAFTHCLRTKYSETGADKVDDKVYAPGVGPVKDGDFALVKIARTVLRKRAEVEID